MLVVGVLVLGEFFRDSAESLELNDARTDAFSASTPTAGPLASSWAVGVGAAEVVSEAIAGVLVFGEFLSDSAESLEFNDAITDAFSASTPTDGTFPSSVSLGIAAGEVASEVAVGTSGEPVPL